MKLDVARGKYVVAVSGGVDSVVLLAALQSLPGLELVVAHFDHGMRPTSAQDAQFVADLAKRYGLTFVTERVELGPDASEAVARTARYQFLRRVRTEVGAQAIMTAHHQDDRLETAIFNILRGTGRRGVTALQSTDELLRPLLDLPKTELQAYALKQKLSWREDTTNHDERYARNYIRHRLLVRFDANARQQLLGIIERLQLINRELDELLVDTLSLGILDSALDRKLFTQLPHVIAKELLMTWLRNQGIADYDKQTIERLTVLCKTKPAGKRLDVGRGYRIVVGKTHLALEAPER